MEDRPVSDTDNTTEPTDNSLLNKPPNNYTPGQDSNNDLVAEDLCNSDYDRKDGFKLYGGHSDERFRRIAEEDIHGTDSPTRAPNNHLPRLISNLGHQCGQNDGEDIQNNPDVNHCYGYNVERDDTSSPTAVGIDSCPAMTTTPPNFLTTPTTTMTTSGNATPTSTSAKSPSILATSSTSSSSSSSSSGIFGCPPDVVSSTVLVPSSATSSSSASLSSSSAVKVRCPVVIKTEPQDDIKDYVETTMNELLGWYGLPKIDKGDTGTLALTSYPTTDPGHRGHHALDPEVSNKVQDHHPLVKGVTRVNSITSIANNNSSGSNNNNNNDDSNNTTNNSNDSLKIRNDDPQMNDCDRTNKCDEDENDDDSGDDRDDDDREAARKLVNDSNNNNNNDGNSNTTTTASTIITSNTMNSNNNSATTTITTNNTISNSNNKSVTKVHHRHRLLANDLAGNRASHVSDHKANDDDDEGNDGAEEEDDDDEEFEEDLNHVRDSVSCSSDVSASGLSSPGITNSIGGVPEGDRRVLIVCSWCQKQGRKMFTLDTAVGSKVFCSEICFTQCRRASFKKNKMCDWCKHVRHTVNFVDFQDGDIQLQFCSEKCLNQYKMNIFCSEAQQHLQHMQILEGKSGKSKKSDGNKKAKSGELLITPDLWLSGNGDRDVIKQEIQDDPMDVRDEVMDCESGNKSMIEDEDQDGDDNDDEDYDDDEEPGELREMEKAHRTLMLEQDRNQSHQERNRDRERDPHRKSIDVFSRNRTCSSSVSCDLRPNKDATRRDTLPRSSDNKPRRDRERTRRLLVGESRLYSNRDSQIIHGNQVSNSAKEEPETSTSAKTTGFLPPSSTPSAGFMPTSLSADHLLPHWATSQLLALMPQHLNPAAHPTAFGRHPNLMGYPSSAMLYTSLLESATKAASTSASASSSSSDATAATTAEERRRQASSPDHRRLRHESRRELLRDRDLSKEKHHERIRLRDERSASIHGSVVAPSPTISQSSDGTPGPTPLTPLPHQSPTIFPGFQRPPCPFPIPLDSNVSHATLQSLFADPNQANMLLQLQMALQHGARENIPLLPSTHNLPGLPTAQQPHPPPRPPPPPLPAQPSIRVQPSPISTMNGPNATNLLPSHSVISNGLPPVTVLVPYPVAIPIPVPIPIPIPIAPEKLAAFFNEKSEASTSTKPSTSATPPSWSANTEQSDIMSRSRSNTFCDASVSKTSPRPGTYSDTPIRYGISNDAPRSRSSSEGQSHAVARSQAAANRDRRSSSPCISQPVASFGVIRSPASTSAPLLDSPDPALRLPSGRDSADSIMTLRREIVRAHGRDIFPSSSSSPLSMKRSISPSTSSALEMDQSASKNPRLEMSCSSSSEDQAIDLSKMSSRSISPRRAINDQSEKENAQSLTKLHVLDDRRLQDLRALPQNLKVPKIHIVSERPDPPLAQAPPSVPLPPSPVQSSYSSRRSRILDAPSVPKRPHSHSPSPERRYVRTVPKDMVEAAKRRGLRARVRTK